MSEYVECYENLKAAVVKLAADDYRRALIRLRRHPKDTNALHTKIECELFFRKDIEVYSDMDGEVLIILMRRAEKRLILRRISKSWYQQEVQNPCFRLWHQIFATI